MGLSIDRKEHPALGGLSQTVHIWGSAAHKPVLLFLHGGPGIPNRHTVRRCHLDLCDDFTVVAWDQRGCGGSYAGCPRESLTLDRMVDDAAELVEWLCQQLQVDRVFLLGGSWGTELGTFLVARNPEHLGGYVGYGQVVNGVANEDLSYAYCVEKATAAGDQESLDTLRRVGPPVRGQYTPVLQGLLDQRKILSHYGGHSVKKEHYVLDTALPILTSPEYTLSDKLGVVKGYRFSLENLWPTIVDYDFVASPHDFAVPYFIFQGRHDNNTPSALVQDYYDSITAPDKDLVWFENSAHGPLGEEPERFKALLREKLLEL